MIDREKIINYAEETLSNVLPDEKDTSGIMVKVGWIREVLALLKEQDELLHKKHKDIDRLCAEISEWKHKYHDRPLKEQGAVERTCRKGINGFSIIWTCGACGSDLYPNNAKAKYCSNCGQAVKWDE